MAQKFIYNRWRRTKNKSFNEIQDTISENVELRLGTGNNYNNYLIQHNATNSLMNNYTGDLYLRNFAGNAFKDIIFQSDDGSFSSYRTNEYFRLDGGNVNVSVSKNFNFQEIHTEKQEFRKF